MELSRATLGRWTGAVAELLEPLYDVLRQYVLVPGKVHADDIPVPVQEPGSGKTRTARLWAYVRDDRNAGSQMPPAVWFAYSPDRKGIHPQNHLAGYSGVFQADAYGGYPEAIRKVIYTTNAIESLNSVIRHAIKKRKVFQTDESVKKVVWLAIQSASQKWTMPLQDWRIAMSRFIIKFGDRLDGHF